MFFLLPHTVDTLLFVKHPVDCQMLHIGAALAYIGEKSRGISPSRGIYRLSLLINMIFTLYFEVSPGISMRWGEVLLEGVGYGLPFSNPMRVPLHFSSSRGI